MTSHSGVDWYAIPWSTGRSGPPVEGRRGRGILLSVVWSGSRSRADLRSTGRSKKPVVFVSCDVINWSKLVGQSPP